MSESAKLNFRISRLCHRMRGTQADICLLSAAGPGCPNAAARLALIARREAWPCPETNR